MHPPGADVVVVRHGDVGVKSSSVQRKMERRLRDQVVALLADRGVDADVERQWSRLLVRTDEVERATDAATDAFGVVSASPAVSVSPERDAIFEALRETARERYGGGTFAVRARRATDALPFTSQDVEREGGAAIWEAAEAASVDPEVDLDDPDLTFRVEVREDEAFVFLEKRAGPGGLPLGSQSSVVALLSGGIDSPVAAWAAMKRGCPIVPLYFDFGDYGGPDHVARAVEAADTLARYAPDRDMGLRVVDAGDVADDLVASVGATRMLSLRRFMLRAAEAVAREEGARGVVTGEAIGQKSSQTSANLATTSAATELPVHRPLLSRDKQEIIALAREIGTYRDATIPAGCNRIAPSHPETRARLAAVVDAEPDDLLERAAAAGANADRLDPPPA